jgi:hypothetical protein
MVRGGGESWVDDIPLSFDTGDLFDRIGLLSAEQVFEYIAS